MKKFLTLILFFALFSCASKPLKREFIVKVDAISANENSQNLSYFITPASKLISAGDLQFKEYKKQVEKILAEAGFKKAKTRSDAKMIIFLYYSNTPEERSFNYATPIYNQSGFLPMTSYGGIYTGSGSFNSYSLGTIYNPSFINGYMYNSATYTHYTQLLILSAVKNSKKIDEEIWRITAESAKTSDDLREIFPALAIATADYLGKNSGHKITIKIAADDEKITQLKK